MPKLQDFEHGDREADALDADGLEVVDLDADGLGAAGESAFEYLCTRAELACNRSLRDRTGWDFIVEFPFETARRRADRTKATPQSGSLALAQPSLDHRGKAITSHVQVKATRGRSDRIALRLSSAEHLAKDPKPAFIIVPLMTPGGDVRSAYLIHFADAALGKVLRRLRQAEADGKTDINHATVSFDYRRQGVRFAWTPAGLRKALTSAVGGPLSEYVVAKQAQLKTLGYDGPRFEMDTSFSVARADFPDVLLGLKSFKVSALQTFDRRFGIRLPVDRYDASHNVELRIIPKAFATCRVVVHGLPLTVPAAFDGEALGPLPIAPLTEDQVKIIVRADPFTLTLTAERLTFNFILKAEMQRSATEWRRIFRALTHLATGQASLAIQPDGLPRDTINVPITQPIAGELIPEQPEIGALTELGERLLALADVTSGPMTLDDIAAAAVPLRNAESVLFDEPPTLQLQLEGELPKGTPDTVVALFVDHVTWGGRTLAYSMTGQFRRTGGEGDWIFDTAVTADKTEYICDGDVEAWAMAQSAALPERLILCRAPGFDSHVALVSPANES